MRLCIYLIVFLNLISAKEIRSKTQNQITSNSQFVPANGTSPDNLSDVIPLRNSRNDTTTVWLEDFEGDVSGWEVEEEWELTEESSSSPTHSMRFDDDYIDAFSSMISPLISLPEINDPEAEVLKMNFDLWCDLPDWFGELDPETGGTYLGDYFVVDIANMSENPVYFSPSSTDSWDGESWWCANDGGYEDAWMQALSSPEIFIPQGATLSAMMRWRGDRR